MNISENVDVDETSFEMRLGSRYARYKSLEELEKAINQFIIDCHKFAEEHPNIFCSYSIEEACFPCV